MVERNSPFAEPVDTQRAGITLSAPPRGSLWQVACWPETFKVVESELSAALGHPAPAPGRMVPTADQRLWGRVEPLKWWVIGPDGAECPVRPEPDQGAWLDLSHDQAGIVIAGENAPELIKRMVSIDLREAAFPDLSFATTELHHMITRVLRRDGDGASYQMWVMRSYADTLHEVAAHHLEHLGITA